VNTMRHAAITSGAEAESRMSGAATENPTTESARTSSGEVAGFCAGVMGVVTRTN